MESLGHGEWEERKRVKVKRDLVLRRQCSTTSKLRAKILRRGVQSKVQVTYRSILSGLTNGSAFEAVDARKWLRMRCEIADTAFADEDKSQPTSRDIAIILTIQVNYTVTVASALVSRCYYLGYS